MFDGHYRLYSRILLAVDTVAVLPALLAAYHSRSWVMLVAPDHFSQRFHPVLLPFSDYAVYALMFLPVWFGALLLTQRYEHLLRQPLRRQMERSLYFLVFSGSLMGLATYALKLEVSRPIFFVFFAIMLVVLPLNRALLHLVLRSRNLGEHNQVRILIVGTDEKARRVGQLLEDSRKWGYNLIGYVRTNGEAEAVSEAHLVGSLQELPELLERDAIADEVIFSGVSKRELEAYDSILKFCEELGIRTRIAADFLPVSTTAVSLEYLDNLPLITFASVPEHDLSVVIKRVIDFLVASFGLVMLSPVMLAAAAAIKFTSPGPVFYRQLRCGLYGRRFFLVKFRTMIDGAEDRLWEIRHLNEMDGPVFKMRDDPRVTPLGGFLRRYSIDELPQLWNVIKGEMSIVGPRAPLPEEVLHYSLGQRRRLSVRPGITCLWQVSGRSDISFDKWMELDLHYIDNWSVWLDLSILLRTIPAVFTGRGAR